MCIVKKLRLKRKLYYENLAKLNCFFSQIKSKL